MFKRELPAEAEEPVLPDNAIEIRKLCKAYPATKRRPELMALDDVDLVVPRGSLFGLLGPNGAGKSTLINILANVVVKSSGDVRIWDIDLEEQPRRAARAIGIVPQELNFDPFFTARELLDSQAGLYGVPRRERITDELLDMLELADVADVSTRNLSGGMRRRLMVAKSMVHRPPVLVLDEPTAGVDVDLRHTLWEQIQKLRKTGTTILLTTHYLEEAQALCDQIAILHMGKIVANDTMENLLQRLDNKSFVVTVDRDLNDVPPNLRPHGWVLEGKRKLKLPSRPTKMSLGQMLLSVQVNGLNVMDIVTQETDLEDVFLQITKSA